MKHFIITVDTEGDNLWTYTPGDSIEVNNANFLPRFQKLCEKYGFKPVYLTNYEMAQSEKFVVEARNWLKSGMCEIGIHLHAWNNPPHYNLEGAFSGNPYLIEYPFEIMRAKFKKVYDLISEKFSVSPISHRAGRWAMDERYFKILKEFGVLIDCSYTPGINWEKAKGITRGGSDYTNASSGVSYINGVMEIPATLRQFRNACNGSWKHRIKSMIKGEQVWLRPATSSLSAMKKVIDIVDNEGETDFVEFMIHSSEVMPGGSPYFTSKADIEREYKIMDELFEYASRKGYVGTTLEEYYLTHKQ